MKNLNKKIILIAIIFSLLTTYLIYNYLKGVKKSEPEVKYTTIIVAATDIFPRTKITSDMVNEVKVIEGSYLTESVQDKSKIVGMYTKERILMGEVIPQDRIMEESKTDLCINIPENKRAISVAVDQFNGVADLIKPGDYVDVYATVSEVVIDNIEYSDISKLILQNIQVLAIDKEQLRKDDERNDTPDVYSVTLAVSPSDGQKLVLGSNAGIINLALRPLGEEQEVDTSWVSKESLVIDEAE